METIRAIVAFAIKFILLNIAVVAGILIYPIAVVAIPLVALRYADADTMRIVAMGYAFVLPLFAGFWFLMTIHLPDFYAAKKRGEKMDTWNLAFHFKAVGQMAFGWVASYAMTLFAISNLAHASAGVWFLTLAVAVNSPILVLLLARYANRVIGFNSTGLSACVMCHGSIRGTVCSKCGVDYSVVA